MDVYEKNLLKDVLLQGSPILFLGAGFSLGACQKDGTPLPMSNELKGKLFDNYIKDNDEIDDKDKSEISSGNLRSICSAIDSLGMDKEMKKCLTSIFSVCGAASFHRMITAYPWKKIYTVNIDDIVEQQFEKAGKPYVAQNEKKKKDVSPNDTEIIKLHGCVNAPDEPYIFSDRDYYNLTSGELNYRLNDLTVDLQNQNMIFLGTNMDEPDIQHYFSIYEKAGYQLGRGRIICINPSPTFALKKEIKRIGGNMIQATTEEFLNYLVELNYNPDEHEKSLCRLEYGGIYSFKKTIESQKDEVYESSIYQGYESTWRDLKYNWLFYSPTYQGIAKRIDDIKFSDDSSVYCIAIYGKRFSGKGCLMKLLSMHLHNEGYEVLYYNGLKLDVDSLVDYIETSPNNRFALMVSAAAFYYKDIETLFKKRLNTKKLLVITTSREYHHKKKKYYLDGNPYEEHEMTDLIKKEYAEMIFDTLYEKGYTGWLHREKSEAVPQICEKKTIANLLSTICFGEGFHERLDKDLTQIKRNKKIFHLYELLAIIDRADLEYYPKRLLWNKYRLYFRQDKPSDKGKFVVDYISCSEKGLTLKNKIIIDDIWKGISENEKKNCIAEILQSISPFVFEHENSYWRIMFESLANEKWLKEEVGLSSDEILNMYYSLKNYYGEISYYWLQLGIAEQEKGEYQKAQAHLDMAAEIRPRAYQIRHAIARNYLRHSNSKETLLEADPLFKTGKEMMMRLINSDDFNKRRAKDFSIHCYVTEYMKHVNRFIKRPSREQVKEMKDLIDIMTEKQGVHYKSLLAEYARFLKKTNTAEYVTFHLQDELLHEYLRLDEDDYIIDSYQ